MKFIINLSLEKAVIIFFLIVSIILLSLTIIL
jgi:hypothetical protein